MGSTCSTLDVASDEAARRRKKDAAALEWEIDCWRKADAECRSLRTETTSDARAASRQQSQPRGFSESQAIMGCSTSKTAQTRRSSKLDAVKAKQAEDLELEIARWMAVDKECRGLCCTSAPDPSASSRALPAFDDDTAGWHVQFAVDSISIVVMPTAEEMGPHLAREVYWTRADFDTMMHDPVRNYNQRERKLLAIKAARFMRRHPDKVLDKKGKPVPVDAGESLCGLGIGPYEQAILGNRKARNARIKRYNDRIFALHRQASSADNAEDWDACRPESCEGLEAHRVCDEYSFVAAKANDLDSTVYNISKRNFEGAHKLAEEEHRQLMASLTPAERDTRDHFKRRAAARLAKSPVRALRKSQRSARKNEKLFPDGAAPVSPGAEEHLAAIHYESFDHRLLRADSFDDFEDTSGHKMAFNQ